jgi:hypothetical protein
MPLATWSAMLSASRTGSNDLQLSRRDGGRDALQQLCPHTCVGGTDHNDMRVGSKHCSDCTLYNKERAYARVAPAVIHKMQQVII